MKSSKIKFILKLFIILFLVSIIIIYNREDYKFIIANNIEKIAVGVEVEKLNIKKENLQVVPLDDIKNNHEIQFNDSLNLINRDFPIRGDKEIDIVNYKDTDLKMQKILVEPYQALSKAVKEETSEDLFIRSSFRTSEEQRELSSKEIKIAAMPGASEHEKGLALDVYVKFFSGSGFLKSKTGQFVNRNSWEYGFIIRYPIDKKGVTGVPFEPWHIRYVGKPHAEIIYKNNLALEEYIDSLEMDNFYRFDDYIISRQRDHILTFPKGLKDIIISPDNMGNYIITGLLED